MHSQFQRFSIVRRIGFVERPLIFQNVFFPLVFLWVLFSGCIQPQQKIAVLRTDIPEFAYYTSVFNSIQNNYLIKIIYSEHPEESLLTDPSGTDLVIGKSLWKLAEHLQNLDFLFLTKKVNRRHFYKGMLESSKIDGKQYLLPVGFSLPILLRRADKNQSQTMESAFLSIDTLRSEEKNFNQKQNGQYTRLGFVPTLVPDFLFYTGRLFQTNFREQRNTLVWNSEKLESTIRFLQDWMQSSHDGYETEKVFIQKYCLDPVFQLVLKNRVKYALTQFPDYYRLPDEYKESLDYSYLVQNDQIPVQESVIHLGLLKNSAAHNSALSFIAWFFHPTNQVKLIADCRKKQMHSFGIADNFSSLIFVNERAFVEFFPLMKSFMPQEKFLLFPLMLPAKWQKIKTDAVLPWMLQCFSNNAVEPETLKKSIQLWKNQNPNE